MFIDPRTGGLGFVHKQYKLVIELFSRSDSITRSYAFCISPIEALVADILIFNIKDVIARFIVRSGPVGILVNTSIKL